MSRKLVKKAKGLGRDAITAFVDPNRSIPDLTKPRKKKLKAGAKVKALPKIKGRSRRPKHV
jgi:hypothetical protein